MSIEKAEQLKAEWTDKYVTVREGVPELRRFVGFVGQVKTVNMNCRALVEFDSPEDISWYDIDPSFLKLADAPLSKSETKQEAGGTKTGKASATKADTSAATKKVSAADMAGLSPLEKARLQGAVSKSGAKSDSSGDTSGPSSTATDGKAAKTPATTKPKPAAKSSGSGNTSGLSPLDLARQQGAAGRQPKSTGSKSTADTTKKPEKSAPRDTAASSSTASSTAKSTAGLSALELARQQGAVGSGNSNPAKTDTPTNPSTTNDTSRVAGAGLSAFSEGSPGNASDQSGNNTSSTKESSSIQPLMSAQTPADKPTAKQTPTSTGLSALELARQQGAVGSKPSGTDSPAPQKPGNKDDSSDNTDKGTNTDSASINQAASAASGAATGSLGEIAAAAASAGASIQSPETTGLSPLELARRQGAPGSSKEYDTKATSVQKTPTPPVTGDSQQSQKLGGAEDPVAKLRGKKVKPDDLKIIEGIGPKIEELLKAAGVKTWVELAEASGEQLKEILVAGGSRFQMHDPTSWPFQSALAATGKWDELEKLQDELDGGK